MYCLHNHLFLKFFYLEFSGLFYCSVINVHFASKTLYSLALSAVLMTYFVCVSEIYIITLALTCQALFWFFVFLFWRILLRFFQNNIHNLLLSFDFSRDNEWYIITYLSLCQQLCRKKSKKIITVQPFISYIYKPASYAISRCYAAYIYLAFNKYGTVNNTLYANTTMTSH